MFAGWWGKMPGTVLRLALVLEMLWWCGKDAAAEPDSVSEDAVIASVGLVEEYLKPMAERAYGDDALPQDERNAATLAKWFLRERPETINLRDLRRNIRLPGMQTAEAVKAAVKNLKDGCWVFEAGKRAGKTHGRQRADYRVNPLVRTAEQ